MAASQYAKHLYTEDCGGYIQVMQLAGSLPINIYNTDVKGIAEVVEGQIGMFDTFITPNTFYIPKRANTNIRQFRALYIDIDLNEFSKAEAQTEIYLKTVTGEIPKPTMIIDSGRGLHIYWRIEHAPMGAAHTWQELQDYLYNQLRPLGADIKATDSARVLRLPGTLNSRNNALCEVLEYNENKYSMYDLREKYLHYFKEDKQAKPQQQHNIKRLFNSYTLHIARADDIQTITQLRNYQVVGYRNALIHLYSYWKGIYNRDPDNLLEVVQEFNESLRQPIKDNEVKAIVRSTTKAVERFITYEQGIRSGEEKRVSKAMRERGGYWYTNASLINMLDITEAEQRELKTIISTKEKYRRKNEARNEARRNENGLTQKQQSKADNIKRVKELTYKGMSQNAIAREMGISQQYVSQLLSKY